MFLCSFLAICCFGYSPGLCAGVPFLPSLGAVERLDLHRHLLFDGFSFGNVAFNTRF